MVSAEYLSVAKLKEIVIDAQEPASLARFWAAALDDYQLRPYDQAELDRLAERSLTPESDTSVALDGPGPTLFFQAAAAAKTSRNRIHLDVSCESRTSEVKRLIQLGAQIRDVHETYTVMLDPEGNEFCVQEPAT